MNTHYVIKVYFRSPQSSTYETTRLNKMLSDFQDGKMSSQESRELRHLLLTRLDLHNAVDRYVQELGISQIPPIEKWWESHTCHLYNRRDFQSAYDIIVESGLLNLSLDPRGHRLLYYQKPARYLAAGMCLAGYGVRDVENTVRKLWLFDPYSAYVVRYYDTSPYGGLGLGSNRDVATRDYDHVAKRDLVKKRWKGLKHFGGTILEYLGRGHGVLV